MNDYDVSVLVCGFVLYVVLWFVGEGASAFYRAFSVRGE